MPGFPPPDLVVVVSDLALGLGEALFHRPAILAHPHQLLHGRPLGAVGLVEAQILGVVGAPADQEPAPHAPLRVWGQVYTGPLPRASAAATVPGGTHLGESTLGQARDVPLYLLLASSERNRVGLRNHHRVGTPSLLQPHPEGVGPPVEGVRDHPSGGHVGLERSLQHPLGQLHLVAEDELLGNAGLGPSHWVARPHPGQVERPVDEGGAFLRGVGQEHPDLAVERVPAVPVYWRATPTLFSPFFRKPVSSTMSTPLASSARCSSTYSRRSSRTSSASHLAEFSSRW